MARGFGAKAARTGKCKCDNPRHSVFATRITQSGELVISITCDRCKALWDTKSIEGRKYLGNYNIGAVIVADRKRKEILELNIKRQQEILLSAQKEIEKMEKELRDVEDRILCFDKH